MSSLTIPEGYRNLLNFSQTEKAIKLIKDTFQQQLSSELKLKRVTAPLFVLKGTGINDDLSGVETKVTFRIKDLKNTEAEVVNSLAKWKRMALAEYGILPGYGIYTDMNAIRPDEILDNLHSLYVDQWDWELVITPEQKNIEFLKSVVTRIYEAIRRTEYVVEEYYPQIRPDLPSRITFIHSEDLFREYPDKPPREREFEAVKKFGAVFIIGIGATLPNGEPHDSRAPDYDDWITETVEGHKGLNGDIILWNPILKNTFEISSMGIRVDRQSLARQLEISGNTSRKSLLFHTRLLKGELPYTIGGGIGQSRLCMYYLRKAHIGEVQSSIWPADMIEECRKNEIMLF
ncbi:MAG TPA: aspartate--ammonia ligase [Cyclobacteriaceae bacterium]|nr:aspartate--ammonia ligase [Cyclobacteriaceae bacterium]